MLRLKYWEVLLTRVLLLAVVLVGLWVLLMCCGGNRLIIRWVYPGQIRLKSSICYSGIGSLGIELTEYAEHHGGRFPANPPGSDRYGLPGWLHTILTDSLSKNRYPSIIIGCLKCPEDLGGYATSYELVYAGKSYKDIPHGEARVLLRERNFAGSHHFIIYVDGEGRSFHPYPIPKIK